MNNGSYRLASSKLRGMFVAAAGTAMAHGRANQEDTGASSALVFAGAASARIQPSGAHAPNVISTASGLHQINITKPSRADVSMHTYSPFDVQSTARRA
ncbi:hypothetical protein ACFPTO_10790 [Paraburkholderia denitrificans]|uniref:ESPR domain-containing protein n=1 Tax=Paraburkholderia denitrificans TaxID=694025 RepID=A0ABW0J8C2_9BURK